MSVYLESAWDQISGPLRDWIHRPSGGKQPLLEAYQGLSAREKVALAAEVRQTMLEAHGVPFVTAYRRHKGEQRPLGMTSLTTNPRAVEYLDASKYDVYLVPAEAVMLHWATPGSPLGSRSFRHEQEIILLPNADEIIQR